MARDFSNDLVRLFLPRPATGNPGPGRIGGGAGGRARARDMPGSGLHHPLACLVPDHRVQRIRALRGGILGVGVVDVEPRTVGEDHVGRTDLVGVHHRRRACDRLRSNPRDRAGATPPRNPSGCAWPAEYRQRPRTPALPASTSGSDSRSDRTATRYRTRPRSR